MRTDRRFWIGIVFVSATLLACTLTHQTSTPPDPTTTMPGLPADQVTGPLPATTDILLPFPTLETITAPFEDMTTLLDGVCFEYLLSMNGTSWVWTAPGELSDFYDQVDESGLCKSPIPRGSFDFSRGLLAGTVSASAGCDAAYQVAEFFQDHSTRTQTLLLQYIVQPGCPYELAQPLVVAVPHPPSGYAVRVVVTAP